VAEENRKSLLADILKRERLDKLLNKDKTQEIKKATNLVKSKESNNQSSANSKDLQDRVNSSKANNSFDIAINEALIDIRYYFLKEGEYSAKFRNLYLQNKNELDKYAIDARKFLDYSREAFDRYKKTKNMMPLDPMKPKAFDYVETNVKDLIKMLAERFGK
jgi:hypothetical protein